MPGFLEEVAGTNLPASYVNSYLMRQAVIQCTSGSRPSAPHEGMTIYETDTDRFLQYTTATTGWQPPWNMPWGVVAVATTTTGTPSFTTTVTDLTNLTTGSVTYVANRRLRISGRAQLASTVASDVVDLRVRNAAGTQLSRSSCKMSATANETTTWDVFALVLGTTAGAETYRLSGARTVGSGNITTAPGATDPDYIVVEDIGPSAAPA